MCNLNLTKFKKVFFIQINCIKIHKEQSTCRHIENFKQQLFDDQKNYKMCKNIYIHMVCNLKKNF